MDHSISFPFSARLFRNACTFSTNASMTSFDTSPRLCVAPSTMTPSNFPPAASLAAFHRPSSATLSTNSGTHWSFSLYNIMIGVSVGSLPNVSFNVLLLRSEEKKSSSPCGLPSSSSGAAREYLRHDGISTGSQICLRGRGGRCMYVPSFSAHRRALKSWSHLSRDYLLAATIFDPRFTEVYRRQVLRLASKHDYHLAVAHYIQSVSPWRRGWLEEHEGWKYQRPVG